MLRRASKLAVFAAILIRIPALCDEVAAAAGSRQLFTVTFATEGPEVLVPVRLSHDLGDGARSLKQIGLNGKALGTCPVFMTGPGEVTTLLPALPTGRRVFWLGREAAPPTSSQVRLDGMTVTARTYVAQMAPERGGILQSVRVLGPGGKQIETLGEGGMQWNWTGSSGRAAQSDCGTTPVRVVENGPARVVVETTAADVCAPGNAFTVTTTFYPDCIDQRYQYHHKTLFQTSALKIWCFLGAKSYRPGYEVGATTPKTPLRKAGVAVWTEDPLYVDMTFDDPAGFGLGFVELHGCKLVFMNDIARTGDQYNLFVDATGYNAKMQDVTADVDEEIRLIPHGPGPEAWRTTQALASAPRVQALGVQKPGGPLPDSDGDGLDDLAELRLGTNPLAADTDADGIPDGRDRDPLQNDNPSAAVSPSPPGPLAPPTTTTRPQAVGRVQNVGGNPTIVVNGKPFGPVTFTLPGDYNPEYAKPFVAADMRIFSIYTDGGFSKPGEEGMTHLDQQAKVILDANPKAYIMVRPMFIETPLPWAKAHPSELLTFEDGGTLIKDGGEAKDGIPHYTFASEVWKADVGQALRRLIDHVRASSYSDRVIGYFLGAGYPTEEWIYAKWGPDYSPAMQDAFRRFLIRRYNGSVVALRAAWKDDEADFATAVSPPAEEWQATNLGDFWDPALGCKLADYFRCHNETEAEKLEYFSRVVKAATGGNGLCGFWYINLACVSHHFSGHEALEKMLSCPTIDLFGAPSPYENRCPGSDAPLRSVTDSVKLHGKVWYSNTDTRTYLADHDNDQYGRPVDLAGSLALLTRDFATLLTRGVQGEWYEMGAWYRGPEILSSSAP